MWVDQIPDKTLVWAANRDNPAPEGSVAGIINGDFVLNDPQGQQIWKASANGTVTSGSLLNSGNLVLMGSGSSRRWESFMVPTDTILPTQTLELFSSLSSSASETNYSSGKYQFVLQGDGNLVLQAVAIPSRYSYGAYWSSGTEGNGTLLVFNQTGYIYIVLRSGGRSNLTIGPPVSTSEFYMRATIDYEGVFRQYVYPKKNSSNGSWTKSWSSVLSLPEDICMAQALDNGGGVCGFNGYCKLEGDRPSCLCPTGYSYIDESDKFKGCKQDFVSDVCSSDGSGEASSFEMEDLINTDWPLSDYEHYNIMNENDCRKNCLIDCLCAVAISRDNDCWKKKLPLSNGRMSARVRGKALVKVRVANSSTTNDKRPLVRLKKDQGGLVVLLSVISGSFGFLNIVFLALLLFTCRSCHRKVANPEHNLRLVGINLRSFTYKEIEVMTNGFKEELGKGSCGTVYKGIISSDSANIVAVKKLERVLKDAEKELTNEVRAIGRIHHKNLVPLLGFCEEGSNLLLVYEYMSNGSLANFLFDSEIPSWNKRTQIAFGIARGLMYLHEECSTPIIHCDIKPQNILLDSALVPRVSDFGLAKLLKTNQSQTTTYIRGTKGYVAPEWFKNMAITAKVDVYSFGVLLLEIICRRKCYEPDLENECRAILIDWVCDCYKDRRVDLLIEGDEEALDDIRRFERMVLVAIWCIQEEPSLRPSMRKVTQMLEGAVEVPEPPEPCSFISSLA